MALVNIELYEQLKKDVSEESARMLAEVVPPVGDLPTKSDLAGLELTIEQRISRLERRMFGLFLTLLVPVWGVLVASGVKFVIQL